MDGHGHQRPPAHHPGPHPGRGVRGGAGVRPVPDHGGGRGPSGPAVPPDRLPLLPLQGPRRPVPGGPGGGEVHGRSPGRLRQPRGSGGGPRAGRGVRAAVHARAPAAGPPAGHGRADPAALPDHPGPAPDHARPGDPGGADGPAPARRGAGRAARRPRRGVPGDDLLHADELRAAGRLGRPDDGPNRGRPPHAEPDADVSTRQYVLPVDQTKWEIGAHHTTTFTFDYDEGRDRLLSLYEKGKEKQWNTNTRIDWSTDVDPESPDNYPEYYIPIYGSDIYERMTEPERRNYRRLAAAWTNSQFLHGEQGALVCTAKIVQTVPDVDADDRWDMTCLGMQIMIEGLALAAFALIRDFSQEPLAKAINTYVMQDEARHVAFGRLSLREFYPQLTQAERDEREEFVVYASYLMRDRFMGREIYEAAGLPVEECMEYVRNSDMLGEFRKMLFSRIVPTVKDLGLFGPKVQKAFQDMGVIAFADLNPDDLATADEQIAEDLDRRRATAGPDGNGDGRPLADIDPARAAEVERTIRAGAE